MPLINALQNEGTVLALGVILGPVSVAIFQTTRTAVNGARSLTGLAASAVMLEIPALVGEGRLNTVRRLLVVNTQVALAALGGWLLLLAVFGGPIFHLWLHNGAVYSRPLVLLMMASMFPMAFADSFRALLLATNQIHKAVPLLLPAALISLAVTAAGGFLFGLNGAAFGMFAFESMSLLVVCTVASRRTQIQVKATLAEVFSKHSVARTYNSALSTLRLAKCEWS
jgi:O-antigen/teichoic acid export membrane protein